MDNLQVGDKVRAIFHDIIIVGVITGMSKGCCIIRVDVMTNEINALRNNVLDPVGCIVLNPSYIKEVLK